MKVRQDSLNNTALIQDTSSVAITTPADSIAFPDSLVLAGKFGSFATAATGMNKTVRLENEHFIVDFDTKGGKISGVELKNYKKVLLDEKRKEYKGRIILQSYNDSLQKNTESHPATYRRDLR